MKIFNYDPLTREFLGETVADPNPLVDGEWLLPAHSTTIEPSITLDVNEVLVLSEDGNEWSKVEDFRGTEYWLVDGVKVSVDELGEVVPDDALNRPPDLRTVEESIDDALNLVKSKHATVLKDLSGDATVEERDTWPLQKEWAIKYKASQGEHEKNLILGLMTQAEIVTHGDNAAQVMTEKIIAKSSAMDLLTSKAGGLKRTAEEALKSVTDKDQIPLILDSLEEKMSQAIIEFKAETSG